MIGPDPPIAVQLAEVSESSYLLTLPFLTALSTKNINCYILQWLLFELLRRKLFSADDFFKRKMVELYRSMSVGKHNSDSRVVCLLHLIGFESYVGVSMS